MGIVGGVAAVVAVSVALAATLAVYPAVWRAFRQELRRIPLERRSRAWVGLGLFVLTCIVVGVLLISQPWGPHTAVWVCLVGGGAVTVLALAGVTAQAIMDTRRLRRHRAKNE